MGTKTDTPLFIFPSCFLSIGESTQMLQHADRVHLVRRLGEPVATTVITVLASLVAWFRVPPSARDVLWAEDARIFLQRAADHALPEWISTPYAGYSHAVPQATASLVWDLVPIELRAVAVTAAACVIVGSVAGLIFLFTRDWGLGLAGRLLFAGITVLAPGLGYETLGNLTNLHWYLLWLAPFLFLFRPRSWWVSALLCVVALFLLATEIQAVLFLPLLLWSVRDLRRWPIAAGAVLGAGIQVVAYVSHEAVRGQSGANLSATLLGYLLQVPLTAFTGSGPSSSALVGRAGWWIAVTALIPFLACAVWFAWASIRRALLASLFLVASIIIWSTGFWLNFLPEFDFAALSDADLRSGVPLLRYATPAVMFLFAPVALAIGRIHMACASAPGVATTAIAVLLCLAVFTAGLIRADHPIRADGPTWRSLLPTARTMCDSAGTDSAIIQAAPHGWSIAVPCRVLQNP
ncbi:MAG: hypothetical protein QM606_08090 [Leucobacter sp.]